MAKRARLGKGLGALFPELPGEQGEQKTAATAKRTDKGDVSRETSMTRTVQGESRAGLSSASAGKQGASKSGKRKADAGSAAIPSGAADVKSAADAGSAGTAKSAGRKRASVPALGDLSHPSDLFFGAEASSSQSVEPSAATKALADHMAASPYRVSVDDLPATSVRRPTQLRNESSSDMGRHVAQQGPDATNAATAPAERHENTTDAAAAGSAAAADDVASHAAQTQSALSAQSAPSAQSAQSATVDPAELQPVAGGYLAELNIADISPNEHQPRTIFDEDDLMELSDSIKEVGVLQPIVVRRRTSEQIERARKAAAEARAKAEADGQDAAETPAKHPFAGRTDSPYELIMGERRWRASQLAGLTTIPAIVKTTADDDMLRDALLENLHRVALNPLEEAAAYQQMINEFGLTQEQLSKSVSKSRPQIANTLRLLQLPPSVQKKVAAGVLSAGHARALLGLDSEEDMNKLAVRIIGEGLSVRSTEEIVAMMTMDERKAAKPAAKRRSNVWSGSAIEQSLNDRFDTKVAIKGTKKHGRIEITFSSPEDMQRILSMLNPEQPVSDGWV